MRAVLAQQLTARGAALQVNTFAKAVLDTAASLGQSGDKARDQKIVGLSQRTNVAQLLRAGGAQDKTASVAESEKTYCCPRRLRKKDIAANYCCRWNRIGTYHRGFAEPDAELLWWNQRFLTIPLL